MTKVDVFDCPQLYIKNTATHEKPTDQLVPSLKLRRAQLTSPNMTTTLWQSNKYPMEGQVVIS
jgi:hypothetical protein